MKPKMKTTMNGPNKTIWAVFWFVLIGLIVFYINYLFLNKGSDALTSDGPRSNGAGPVLPGSGSASGINDSAPASGFVAAEKDDSIMESMRHISSPHQPIEDLEKKALAFFVRDLRDLAQNGRTSPVRIVHYGDSILTTDQLSGQARFILQRKFGDGGHGFVLLGKPWRWYRHLGVDHGAKGKWRARPFTSDPLQDGLYGLGGVAFQAGRGSHGLAWAGTAVTGDLGREVSLFDVSYLEQPGGGSFSVQIGENKKEIIRTAGDVKKGMHREYQVALGASKLTVQYNNDGPVRVFGTTLETGGPGVVWDSLAINGARASALVRFDEKHWISEIRRRDPSLVILMMGANEGANKFLVLQEYKKHLEGVILRLKKGVPTASCLVVGPLDQAKRNPDGSFGSKKMPRKLGDAQREVALANGCGYFDTWTAMGGQGSMGEWYRRGLGGGDLIHPTEHGAQKIGTWLAESLIYSYQEYPH